MKLVSSREPCAVPQLTWTLLCALCAHSPSFDARAAALPCSPSLCVLAVWLSGLQEAGVLSLYEARRIRHRCVPRSAVAIAHDPQQCLADLLVEVCEGVVDGCGLNMFLFPLASRLPAGVGRRVTRGHTLHMGRLNSALHCAPLLAASGSGRRCLCHAAAPRPLGAAARRRGKRVRHRRRGRAASSWPSAPPSSLLQGLSADRPRSII